MLLEVEHLSVTYGAIRAVNDVSFAVQEGKIVTIIGANGAGKSTIMNALSGIVKPSSGKIYFKNQDITLSAPHEIVKKGIVQVPEGRGIFGNLTVKENLEVAATIRVREDLRDEYEHVFGLFPRLKERFRQVAGTLSGGEQQMLAVARALITKGDLLLLDEPSMGLSPTLTADIFETICRINKEGTTILLVEQNACKAVETANYGYVLETGSIVLEGTAEELKNNPKVIDAYLGA